MRRAASAKEAWQRCGIFTGWVCPGDVATPMLGKQLQQADGSYTLEDVEQAYPLERVGEPLEIAHVICSVLSPFNSFMTGSIIPVDGGLTAK